MAFMGRDGRDEVQHENPGDHSGRRGKTFRERRQALLRSERVGGVSVVDGTGIALILDPTPLELLPAEDFFCQVTNPALGFLLPKGPTVCQKLSLPGENLKPMGTRKMDGQTPNFFLQVGEGASRDDRDFLLLRKAS